MNNEKQPTPQVSENPVPPASPAALPDKESNWIAIDAAYAILEWERDHRRDADKADMVPIILRAIQAASEHSGHAQERELLQACDRPDLYRKLKDEAPVTSKAEDAPRQMERDMIAWRSLAQEMTPGGSEFMSRDAVREYYREFKDSRHRAKLDLLKLRYAAEEYFRVTVRSLRVMGDHSFADSMEKFATKLLSEHSNAAVAAPVSEKLEEIIKQATKEICFLSDNNQVETIVRRVATEVSTLFLGTP